MSFGASSLISTAAVLKSIAIFNVISTLIFCIGNVVLLSCPISFHFAGPKAGFQTKLKNNRLTLSIAEETRIRFAVVIIIIITQRLLIRFVISPKGLKMSAVFKSISTGNAENKSSVLASGTVKFVIVEAANIAESYSVVLQVS